MDIHSFNEYLLSAYYGSGTVTGNGMLATTQIKLLTLEFRVYGGRQERNR